MEIESIYPYKTLVGCTRQILRLTSAACDESKTEYRPTDYVAVLEQMSRLTQTNDTGQLRIIVASERHTFLSSSGRGFWANGRGKRYLELKQSFQGAGERSSDFCFWSSSIQLFSALLSLRRSEKVLSYAGEKTQIGILLTLPCTIHIWDAKNS